MYRRSQEPGNQRRIIIVGKTGNGKSSTGNTILDETRFKALRSLNAMTETCSKFIAYRHDTMKRYTVVDTPGLFDPSQPFTKLAREVLRALDFCPNPHVFLLVFRSSVRLSQEELLTIDMMRIIFGEVFLQHTIVVFTKGSTFASDAEFTTFIEKSDEAMKLVKECGNHVIRIENDPERKNDDLTLKLLEMIEIVSCYGRKHYDYKHINMHRELLDTQLNEATENVDLRQELQSLSDKLHGQLGRSEWRQRLIGGAMVVAGAAVIGTGGAAGLYFAGRVGGAMAIAAPGTLTAIGTQSVQLARAAAPLVGNALATTARVAGVFASKLLWR